MSIFRIYYGDGSDVDGNDRDAWRRAPALDAQVIAVTDPLPASDPRHVGRLVFFGTPFYIWNVNSPVPSCADSFGVLDDLLQRGLIKPKTHITDLSIADLSEWGVKIGRTIATDTFDELLGRAMNDDNMPRKSATRIYETAFFKMARV